MILDMVKHGHPKTIFACISLISWSFCKIFFTEDRSYQYLQDATSFGLLSDKSTVYFNSENLIGIGFSILAALHLGQRGMGNELHDVMHT